MNSAPRLTLHDWSNLRTELVWIYDHAPLDQSRHGVFDHRDGNWAWFLRKGEVRVATKTGELIARAGQWVFLPHEIHRHDFSDDAVLISVRFQCRWPSGEDLFLQPAGVVLDGARFPALEKTARRLESFVRRHIPAPHQNQLRHPTEYPGFLRLQRLFLEWIEAWFEARIATGALPARHTGDERVSRATRLLADAPLAEGFPSAALRASTGISEVQLNRLFQKHLQLTPVQFWERRRVEQARVLLETDDLPLKEISARLGFRGNPHFTVWFQRHAQTSPGRYRAQNRSA